MKELGVRAATGAVYVLLTLGAAWAGPVTTFLLYLPVSMTPAVARWIGSIGGLLVVAGTAANVVALWTAAGPRWRAPLAFLALKAAMQALILLPPLARWAEGSLLRIPYLHWLLERTDHRIQAALRACS